MDDAEDGGVGADAERQRQDGDDGKAGCATERSRGVPHVLLRILQPAHRAFVAMAFFHLLDAAERTLRHSPGIVRRQAAPSKLVFKQREVSVELARKVGLRRAGTDGVEQAHQEASHAPHQVDSPRSSLFTRPDSFRQRSACFSSARVPALVMA